MDKDIFSKETFLGALNLTRDITLHPKETANQQKLDIPTWKTAFCKYALPVIVVTALIHLALTLVFKGFPLIELPMFLVAIIGSLAGVFLFAFIFNFFTKYFDGTENFNAAFFAVTLPVLTYHSISMLSPLPYVGLLISIGAFVYFAYILHKTAPDYLAVPDEKRTRYFWASLISSVLASLFLSMVLFSIMNFSPMQRAQVLSSTSSVVTTSSSGTAAVSDNNVSGAFFAGGLDGVLAHQKYIDAANADRYTPPKDGKLTEEQIEKFIYFKSKAAEIQNQEIDQLEAYSEQADNEDLNYSERLAAMKKMMNVGSAEVRTVKTGNGNWAEHQWVQQQLEAALIHHDADNTAAHNYELIKKHENELNGLL